MSKIVYRKPLLGKEVQSTSELIRVVKTKNNEIVIEKEKKILGRGAYLLRDIGLLATIKKRRLLEKSLKIDIPESIYIELQEMMK
jgi:hypothetical protein